MQWSCTYCRQLASTTMRANYALERSVKGISERAAGAQAIVAPAARGFGLARPAQRGR